MLKFLASETQINCLDLLLTLARCLLHLLGLRLQLLQCHLTLTIIVNTTHVVVNVVLLIHICIALVMSVAGLMTMLLLLLLQSRALVMLRLTQSLRLLLLCRVTNLLARHGLRGRLFFVLVLDDIVALRGGAVRAGKHWLVYLVSGC